MTINSKPESYNYTNSSVYECYMKLCYGTSKKHKVYYNNSAMRNLLDAEDGKTYSVPPSREKQFREVQNRMLKALSYFEKKRNMKFNIIRIGIMISMNGEALCLMCRYALDTLREQIQL